MARPNKNILLLITSTSQTSQSGGLGEMPPPPPFHFYCSVEKCGLSVGLALVVDRMLDLAMDFVFKINLCIILLNN